MRSTRIQLLTLLCVGLWLGPVLSDEPWHIDTQDRLVAVSDVHGAFDAFAGILEKSGIIDASHRWVGGKSRLVVVGDVLDRGSAGRQSLDLIMSLQEQARADGGDVHFVLGNHEIMNIVGDLRYVPIAEFAAFAGSESADVRAAAFAHFLAQSGDAPDPEMAQAKFEDRYPPGFFGHREAYSANGTYGAWLLEQPVLLVAGDTAFVHAGIARAYGGEGGEAINHELKRQLRDYASAMEALEAAGVISPADDFYDHPSIVQAYRERVMLGQAAWPPGAEAAAQQVETLNDAAVFSLTSPTWYRGTVSCSPLIERDHWRNVLAQLGVERLVVGHTPTPDARVLTRMDGGIVRIDTGMLASYYAGRAAALIVDGDRLSVLYADESDPAEPTPQPRRVGARPRRLTDDELEALLSEAPVVDRAPIGARARVTLRRGDIQIDAEFYPAARPSVRPEVAAYRLDRLLGLDMVPVTVARNLDGMPGALQFMPTDIMTEEERSTLGTGGAAWCSLPDQYPAMYIFDTLVHNEGRGLEQIAYDRDSFDLVLLGHEQTFGTQRGRPRHLRDASLQINATWRSALAALDDGRLDEALGDVLSRRQIRALRRRAEELLDGAGGP